MGLRWVPRGLLGFLLLPSPLLPAVWFKNVPNFCLFSPLQFTSMAFFESQHHAARCPGVMVLMLRMRDCDSRPLLLREWRSKARALCLGPRLLGVRDVCLQSPAHNYRCRFPSFSLDFNRTTGVQYENSILKMLHSGSEGSSH